MPLCTDSCSLSVSLLHTLRGMSADGLWMDEAAFLPTDLYTDFALPLLEVGSTTLVLTSTPSDQYSVFQKMLTLVDPVFERPVFASFVLTLVCLRCSKSRKSTACRHCLYKLPPWKKRHKQNEVQLLMEQISEAAVLKESRGVMVDGVHPAIADSTMDYFAAAPLFDAWGPRATMQSTATVDGDSAGDTVDPLMDAYYIATCERESSYSVVAIDPNTTRNKNSSEFALVTLTIVLETILVRTCFIIIFLKLCSVQLRARVGSCLRFALNTFLAIAWRYAMMHCATNSATCPPLLAPTHMAMQAGMSLSIHS